jgi:cell division protein FtsI (penicillin-binding protein 3)
MVPMMDPAVERRVRWMLRMLLLWGVGILGKLIHMQIVEHRYYADLADSQQIHLVELPASRGTIYDRNGHIMAISVPVETVVVNPSTLPDRQVAASILSEILGLDEQKLKKELDERAEKKKTKQKGYGYYEVAKGITQEQAVRLKSLKLGWIQWQSSTVRVYPNDEVAAHLLGGVNREQEGDAGIEQGMEDELGGRPGWASMETDVHGLGFASNVELEPMPGNDVVLTIDHRVQYEAEKSLKKAVIENNCGSGRVVVMNPHTGEILAMASYPTFNPNERVADGAVLQNLAVQSAIEPGSVFKVFTIASAIEEKEVTATSSFHCGFGKMNLFGRIIRDHDPYGYLSVEDILAKSSNIGAIKVGQELGEKRLFEFIKRFGFGSRTGLPLPGESSGKVIRLARWTKSSIGSVAMGHEVMATTVQLGQGVGVIANGGYLVQPKLIQRVKAQERSGLPLRKVSYVEARPAGVTVLSPSTVVTMRKMMEHVVLEGTGKSARVQGYTTGGKTGSAQIYDPKTKTYLHKYHASFMGFAPVNDPQLSIVVTLNGSTKYGGVVAAPVFREVAEASLRIMNVARDLPDDQKLEKVPAEVINDSALSDLSDLSEEKPVEVEDKSEDSVVTTSLVTPNFMGKSLRTVMEEASEKGFRIDPSGVGLVRSQKPLPGTPISYGQKIQLKFGR